jgi:hypothetical protein
VKNNEEEEDVDGVVAWGVAGGAMAEADKGEESRCAEDDGNKVGDRAPFKSNAVRADARERALSFTLLALFGCLALPLGVAVVESTDECASVRGGEGGWSSMGGSRTCWCVVLVVPVPDRLTFPFSNPGSNTKSILRRFVFELPTPPL